MIDATVCTKNKVFSHDCERPFVCRADTYLQHADKCDNEWTDNDSWQHKRWRLSKDRPVADLSNQSFRC